MKPLQTSKDDFEILYIYFIYIYIIILLEREGGGILPAITRQQAVNLVRQSVDCGRYATEPEYTPQGFIG